MRIFRIDYGVYKRRKKYKGRIKGLRMRLFSIPKEERLKFLSDISEHVKFNGSVYKYYRVRKVKHKMSFRKSCVVCGKVPTITHHIVQLQNGGGNQKNNLVKVCMSCHSRIHSWLSDPEIIKKNEEMDKEYSLMVGLDNT